MFVSSWPAMPIYLIYPLKRKEQNDWLSWTGSFLLDSLQVNKYTFSWGDWLESEGALNNSAGLPWNIQVLWLDIRGLR